MLNGVLPSFLKYNTAKDLIRIGKCNDGGYLVSENDIKNSDILIGMGISNDWSFESDFCDIKQVPIIAYDGSVGEEYFFRRMVKSFNRLYRIKRIKKSISTYKSFKSFFSGSNKHIKKFVGLGHNEDNCTMKSVFESIDYNNIFLKIDIEGSEYRVLDDLVKNQNRISGSVIEFHDCDIHLPSIRDFVNNFSLDIIHIHPNNCAPVSTISSMPLVIEISFGRKYIKGNDTITPHDLDMPNDPKKEEICISFEK